MCGIAGIVEKNKPVDTDLLRSMVLCLAHRGPEEQGMWQSDDRHVSFGHRRLAIIDLGEGGRQPRVSPDGKVAITFNGEIYNYLELKEDLQKLGHKFTSESDTEVLLRAYLEWGKDCLLHLNGMFAFAIWDENKHELFAARDRIGEKPFKYYYDNEKFVFASEVKAILKDRAVKREVDWQAIDLALSYRYVPAPFTGFKKIHKLPAGHFLVLNEKGLSIKRYWDPSGKPNNEKSEDEWKKEIWDLFLDSVRHRLISDVPLGAFLSGGVDSTSVVAAASEVSTNRLKTFVIGVEGNSEDLRYARLAAKRFQTDHHEVSVSDIDFGGSIQKLSEFYDEPFFDSSALPSLLINQQIKKHVTVALSGDGADELFGGYKSYNFIKKLKMYDAILGKRSALVPSLLGFSKKHQYETEIMSSGLVGSYTEYFSLWKTSLPKSRYYLTKQDLYKKELREQVDKNGAAELMAGWFGTDMKDIANAAMRSDLVGRLPDGYLAKVDFASMASAVEARTPFLDHRLIKMSQEIPSGLKLKNNGKYIWKEIVKNKIPAEIIQRRKMGFSLPLHKLINKELAPAFQNSVLAEDSRVANYLEKITIKRLWADHLENKADYSNHLWSILMLELWLRNIEK